MDKIMTGYMHKGNDPNNSPTIIKTASILPPDEYALGKGLNECCNPNIGKPNELNERREYYRTQIGVFYCLICGNEMPWYEGQPAHVKVCDACKRAIAWAKEKMKENADE